MFKSQSAYYNNLASGTHTLTLRILSTRNPLSTGYNFNFDYFDAWDGTAMWSAFAGEAATSPFSMHPIILRQVSPLRMFLTKF